MVPDTTPAKSTEYVQADFKTDEDAIKAGWEREETQTLGDGSSIYGWRNPEGRVYAFSHPLAQTAYTSA